MGPTEMDAYTVARRRTFLLKCLHTWTFFFCIVGPFYHLFQVLKPFHFVIFLIDNLVRIMNIITLLCSSLGTYGTRETIP